MTLTTVEYLPRTRIKRAPLRTKKPVDLAELLGVGLTLVLLLIGIAARNSELRYALYVAPIVLFGYAAISEGRINGRHLVAFCLALLVLCAQGVRLSGGTSYIIFIMLPLLTLLTPLRLRREWLIVLLLFVAAYQAALTAQNGFSMLVINANSGASENNTVPGIAGLLAGVFWMLKIRWASALAMVLILVSGKRSVAFSFIVAAVYFIFYYRFAIRVINDRSPWQRSFVYAITIIPLFIIAIYLQDIYQWIGYTFHVNVSLFTSGRIVGQARAYEWLRSSDLAQLFFGAGLGQADLFAVKNWEGVALIHNDYLRMLIDMGVIGTVVFLPSYLRLIGTGKFGPYIVAFSASMWMTGNELIFAYYGLAVVFVILVGRNEEAPGRRQKRAAAFRNLGHVDKG